MFNALLGLISFNNERFLILVKEVEEIGIISNSPILLIKDVYFFSIKYNLDYSFFSEETLSFIKGAKEILKQGMYFSEDYDLTNTLQRMAMNTIKGKALFYSANEEFLWNKKMAEEFKKAKVNMSWLVPLIKGYVDIIDEIINNEPLKVVLISRGGNNRVGIFECTYGIDENGNVANMIETEQIIYYKQETYSFNQIRGSIPVFWTNQGSYINIAQLPEYSIIAFTKHFDHLISTYNRVLILNLLTNIKYSEIKLSRTFEINLETYEKNSDSVVKYYKLDIDDIKVSFC